MYNQIIKKNDEYIVDIIDYGANGEGIAKIDGYTIFVQNALKGEKCKIHILKVLSSHAFAKVEEVLEESTHRVIPDCITYGRCGGCDLRHVDHEETLKIKQEKVQNLVNKMLDEKIIVSETIGMENPIFYRNKAIFPISQNKEVGLFAKRTHDIVEIKECKIQTKISQDIAKYIVSNWKYSIYDEKTKKGLLRSIMIREGFYTHEIMCLLVLSKKADIKIDVKELINKFPNIKTIVININEKDTNVVLGKENIPIYGEGYIIDKLGDYTFKISPNSFYQVNPIQTVKLYNLAMEKANLKQEDVLCDLYCGIGTIGIFAANFVKKVIGIEIVEDAIKDAKENAKLNNIQNIQFILGDVEQAFTKLLNNNIKPNVIIVDPPRKGLDKETISNLNKLKLERLIYISCNPASLVRDLKELEKVYDIKEICPVDNFPYTAHVECVALLQLEQDM